MNADRVMLLIDADNVSVDVMEQAVRLLLNQHGGLHVRRAYCTAESAVANQNAFKRLGIKPMVNLAAGKNSTDIAMAVDAIDLVLSERPDVVVIASSDSDFAPLVQRLREKGCVVRGIGQKGKVGDETQDVYDDFTVLEHRKGAPATAGERPTRKTAGKTTRSVGTRAAGGRASGRSAAGQARGGSAPAPVVPAPVAAGAPIGGARPAAIVPGNLAVPAPSAAPMPVTDPSAAIAVIPAAPAADAADAATAHPTAALKARKPAAQRAAKTAAKTAAKAPVAKKAAAAKKTAAKSAAAKAPRKTAARKTAAAEPAAVATPSAAAPVAAPVSASASASASAPAPAPAPARVSAPSPASAAGKPRGTGRPVQGPRGSASVQAVLACLPELAAGQGLALNVAVQRLREAQLLGKNSSSLKLFAQLGDAFDLLPPSKPTQVRLRR